MMLERRHRSFRPHARDARLRSARWPAVLVVLIAIAGCDRSSPSDAEAAAEPVVRTPVEALSEPPPPSEPEPAPEPATVTLLSHAGTYEITHELVDADAIPLNEPFDFTVRVDPAGDRARAGEPRLEIDAAMPEHGHGMIRMPRVTPLAEGAYRVEGMLLHMAGRWELYFDVTRGGVTERAQCEIVLQ